jgi:hypothetical protein
MSLLLKIDQFPNDPDGTTFSNPHTFARAFHSRGRDKQLHGIPSTTVLYEG